MLPHRFLVAILVFASPFASSSLTAAEPVAKRPPWTTSKLVGTPDPPEPYRVVPAFAKVRFEKPSSIEEIPGANRLLVTEMGGKIFTLKKQADVAAPDLVIDLAAWLPAELREKKVSLFDAELHPRFAENRTVFISYVHPEGGGITRLSRFTLSADDPPRAVAGSEQVLLTWPSGGHNGGCLEFGTDGYLYISTGDGSGPNPPDGLTTGQTVDDLLGAILRIDVDHESVDRNGAALRYTVPKDNPFVDMPGARAEIWSYGLRNPWKFGIDPESGEVFVADNGWESWEMIHRMERGGNGGWPVMEGRASLRSDVKVGPTPIVPPIKDHSHTEANSVIGGPVYRGNKLAALRGAFVYGDYITGTIWCVQPDEDKSYSCTTLCDTDLRIVGFLQGSGGELYVLDYDFTGGIYELVPSGLKDLSATFPRRLSETGLFTKLDPLTPAPGVVPYDVISERWLDGAAAERWVAVPGDGRIELTTDSATAPASYPEGTVLVKQIELPRGDGRTPIRLETQLLHYENGVWHPYSYLWDAAGKEATLAPSIGTARDLRTLAASKAGETPDATLDRMWHTNAVNECKLCHNAGAKFVLGFTPFQLGEAMSGLAASGAIAAAPTVAADAPARLVDPHDLKQSLDDRARSYLHANCGICHHPGGNAIVSFFLRRDVPFDKMNTNKGTGIGTFGLQDARIIVPGDPYRSVLMYRMSKIGYARMPYIGSRLVDSFGVDLVEQWIRSLPHDGSPAPRSSSTSPAERLKTTGDALALAIDLHRKALSGTEAAAAISAGAAVTSSDIRGLFETFVPESKRRPTLGPTVDPQVILAKLGDAGRGKLIYFSDGARCRNCHELDDRAKSLGPTLVEINKKFPQPGDLVQHALQPSLKVDDAFAAYTAVTNDGRVLAGLVVEQSPSEVVLKTAEKQLVRLPRANLDELVKSDKSLMPERILSDLTAQEAADLFAYIRAQRAKE
jgi:putative heme-binding domain-containing protein